jgi:hypothetical protein
LCAAGGGAVAEPGSARDLVFECTVPPLPTNPPQQFPTGDYSYTVELVGQIQNQLGKLTEAVESLKQTTKEQGAELKAVGKDIHAAKVVGTFLIAAASFLGWAIHELVQYLSVHPLK